MSAEPDLSPLDFLLKVMQDETKPMELRVEAATALLPHFHERLSPLRPDNDDEDP